MVNYVGRGTAEGGGFLTTRLHAKHGVYQKGYLVAKKEMEILKYGSGSSK